MTKPILPFAAFLLLACTGGDQDRSQVTVNDTEEDKNKQEMTEEKPAEHFVYVKMETDMGEIVLELDSAKAPVTVNNFLSYVDDGFYDGTIFHRVIDGFMIQGGGFTDEGKQKPTKDPIMLESKTGLKNETGTVAMARTQAPNSATAQFFINVNDNEFLNYTPSNPGYAVFGKVISGMETVNEIKKVKTGTFQQMRDWPEENVMIKSVRRE